MFDLGGSWLQLVAATSDESIIAKDLAARGPGLHHFGLVVESVDDALAHIAAQGLRTIDERGRPGAGDLVVGVRPSKNGARSCGRTRADPVASVHLELSIRDWTSRNTFRPQNGRPR